jgi:glyoxylase I family protein
MKIEHLACNVSDPAAMARWYVAHLGMVVLRGQDIAPYAHFLADSAGAVMLELYFNPTAPLFDFPATAPPTFHLAFRAEDVAAARARLLAAGAVAHGEVETAPNGDVFAIVRDPWGVPVQLVSRGAPLL